MVRTHGLTERLKWNAIHDTIVCKVTFTLKNKLHNSTLVNSTSRVHLQLPIKSHNRIQGSSSSMASKTITPGGKRNKWRG